jgi:hypothetical protein
MRFIDPTKLEAAIVTVRDWVDRRQGEPSHWFGILSFFGGLAAAGALLAASAKFGAAIAVIGAGIVSAGVGAYFGQRAEG